jgi:hypothetical protein
MRKVWKCGRLPEGSLWRLRRFPAIYCYQSHILRDRTPHTTILVYGHQCNTRHKVFGAVLSINNKGNVLILCRSAENKHWKNQKVKLVLNEMGGNVFIFDLLALSA